MAKQVVGNKKFTFTPKGAYKTANRDRPEEALLVKRSQREELPNKEKYTALLNEVAQGNTSPPLPYASPGAVVTEEDYLSQSKDVLAVLDDISRAPRTFGDNLLNPAPHGMQSVIPSFSDDPRMQDDPRTSVIEKPIYIYGTGKSTVSGPLTNSTTSALGGAIKIPDVSPSGNATADRLRATREWLINAAAAKTQFTKAKVQPFEETAQKHLADAQTALEQSRTWKGASSEKEKEYHEAAALSLKQYEIATLQAQSAAEALKDHPDLIGLEKDIAVKTAEADQLQKLYTKELSTESQEQLIDYRAKYRTPPAAKLTKEEEVDLAKRKAAARIEAKLEAMPHETTLLLDRYEKLQDKEAESNDEETKKKLQYERQKTRAQLEEKIAALPAELQIKSYQYLSDRFMLMEQAKTDKIDVATSIAQMRKELEIDSMDAETVKLVDRYNALEDTRQLTKDMDGLRRIDEDLIKTKNELDERMKRAPAAQRASIQDFILRRAVVLATTLKPNAQRKPALMYTQKQIAEIEAVNTSIGNDAVKIYEDTYGVTPGESWASPAKDKELTQQLAEASVYFARSGREPVLLENLSLDAIKRQFAADRALSKQTTTEGKQWMQDYIGRVQGLKNDPALLQAAKLVEGKDMDVRYAALYRKAQQLLAVDSKGAKPETQQALTAMQEYENARLGSPEIMAPAVAERTTQFVRTVYEQNKAEIDALLEQRKPTKEAAGAEIVAAWDRAIARLQNGVWTNPTQAYYDVASATAVDPEKALQISKEIYDIVYSKVAQYTEDTLEKAGYNTKAVLATAENAVRTKLLLESSAWFTQLATSSPIQF